MSVTDKVLDALRQTVLVNERIEQLARRSPSSTPVRLTCAIA